MPDTTRPLDRLLDALQSLQSPVGPRDAPPDAIDRILADPPRRTAVRNLHDDPVVRRFREDLANGLVRVDAANALFGLIRGIIAGAGKMP